MEQSALLFVWYFIFPSFMLVLNQNTYLSYLQVLFIYSRLLTQDGIIETVKRKRYFEKPCRERQRKNFENCRRIYHTEMARKIAFISRTNREDPWLGC